MARLNDLAEIMCSAQLGGRHESSVEAIMRTMDLGPSSTVSRLAEAFQFSEAVRQLAEPRLPGLEGAFASRSRIAETFAENYSMGFARTGHLAERLAREGISSSDLRNPLAMAEVDSRWTAHQTAMATLGDAFRDPIRDSMHWHSLVEDVVEMVQTPSIADLVRQSWSAPSAAWRVPADDFRTFLETGRVHAGLTGIVLEEEPADDGSGVEDSDSPPRPGARVEVVWISDEVLRQLALNPRELARLSPEQLQNFAADRFDRMGYVPTVTGNINRPDGGLDIIAVPKERGPFGIVIGAQVKHHRTGRATGVSAVREIAGWRDRAVHLGMVITNTRFTRNARFEAAQGANKHFVRLKDFADLCRWIRGQYDAVAEWDTLPRRIQLTPEVEIEIPEYLFEEEMG